MFGGRRRRVEKLSAGAAKNLEEGESIRELVQVQTGQSAMANASAVGWSGFMSSELGVAYRVKVNAGPHVLVATDRNLYAMTLSGNRLLDVGDVVIKAPLERARIGREGKQLFFGGEIFNVMAFFGDHADALYEYVRSSAAPAD